MNMSIDLLMLGVAVFGNLFRKIFAIWIDQSDGISCGRVLTTLGLLPADVEINFYSRNRSHTRMTVVPLALFWTPVEHLASKMTFAFWQGCPIPPTHCQLLRYCLKQSLMLAVWPVIIVICAHAKTSIRHTVFLWTNERMCSVSSTLLQNRSMDNKRNSNADCH